MPNRNPVRRATTDVDITTRVVSSSMMVGGRSMPAGGVDWLLESYRSTGSRLKAARRISSKVSHHCCIQDTERFGWVLIGAVMKMGFVIWDLGWSDFRCSFFC